jgi:flagellar motor protein MotB
MNKETLRMQMLAGVITESEYKAIINKKIEEADKKSLKESMIGGIVGIGAINQIPPRAKTDYEMAFEHFLGERIENQNQDPYTMKEGEDGGMVDSNMLKSYLDQMISLADDMEYTPEMVDELENLKNTLSDESMSKEEALEVMQKTIDITEDDIDASEALSQAISGDYELGEGKEVEEPYNY